MLVTPHLLKKIKIDSEAKTKIALTPQQDKHGNTYYLGKWQGPLLLDLSCGVSFMAFVSDDGAEELHISLRDPRKPPRKGGRQVTMLNDGTMKIPLRAANDKYDQTFYVGELTGSLLCQFIWVPSLFSLIQLRAKKSYKFLNFNILKKKMKNLRQLKIKYTTNKV